MKQRRSVTPFPKQPKVFVGAAIAAGLFVLGMSLWIGSQQSTWFDEGYSIILAHQSVGHLVSLTSVDTHPPFYYLLLKVWGTIWGWNPLALRGLSALAMAGAVVVSGFLARRLFGVRAGFVTLVVAMTLPFVIRYGFEIRMYALATLIAALGTYVLVCATQATQHKRALYVLYAVVVALGVYTLYYLALVWIAHLVWLIWTTHRQKKSLVRSWWMKSYILSVIFFLPWLVVFLKQTGNGALSPVAQHLSPEVLTGMASFSFLYKAPWELVPLTTLLLLVIVGTVLWLAVTARRMARGAARTYYGLVLCLLAVPLTVMILLISVSALYVERYLTEFIMGLALIIGGGIAIVSHQRPRVALLLTGLILASTLAGTLTVAADGNYNFQRLQRPNSRQMVATDGCSSTTYIGADAYAFIDASYELRGCTELFYDRKDPAYRGGFAPMHNDDRRVISTSGITTDRIILFGFPKGKEIAVPPAYHLVQTQSFGDSPALVYQRF